MVGGRVERVEIVVRTLDFRPVYDRKAHADENFADAVLHRVQRVQPSAGLLTARQRDVELLLRQPLLQRRAAERGRLAGDGRFQFAAYGVGQLADLAAGVRVQRAHAAQDGGQPALLARIFDAGRFQLRLRRRGGDLRLRLGRYFPEFFLHNLCSAFLS